MDFFDRVHPFFVASLTSERERARFDILTIAYFAVLQFLIK